MLSDTERKLVRIISNQHRRDWHRPDLEQLALRSQRDIKTVRLAMRKLWRDGYVEVKEGYVRLVKEE